MEWWSWGGAEERGNSSFLSLLPEALQLTQLWPSGWAEGPRRLGAVFSRTPEPSPGLPSGPEAVANLPHPCSCDLVSPGCSLWDLVLLSPLTPNSIWAAWGIWGPVGFWAPGSLSYDSWTGSGDLALRKLPTEISLLLARTGRTSEGESCALGPCPFLSGQRITFVWWRFTGTVLPDLKNKGSDTKKFATTN